MRKIFYPILICVFIVGCASPRPILYPNPQYQKVGKEKAEKDVDLALKSASEFGLHSTSHEGDLQDTVSSTASGTAAGTAAGGIYGQTGRAVGMGAAAGAAGGAAAGGTRSLFKWIFGSSQPSSAYRRFVEKNLQEKGYEVIGWD